MVSIFGSITAVVEGTRDVFTARRTVVTTTLVQTVSLVVGDGSRAFRCDDVSTGADPVEPSSPPVAILLTVGDDAAGAERIIDRIRARPDLLAYTPMLVIDAQATLTEAWVPPGADQILSARPDTDLLAAWTLEPNEVVPRLVTHFGQAAIVPLLMGFRRSLLALGGSFVDGDAHQVGGLAGTLGYRALGTACEALRDEPAMLAIVLREIRKAIYDVSQHVETYARE